MPKRWSGSTGQRVIATALSVMLALGGMPVQASGEALEEAVIGAVEEASVDEVVCEPADAEAITAEDAGAPGATDEENAGEASVPQTEGQPDPGDEGPAEDADPMEAQASSIASGTWGTCPWEISASGVLTVRPGEGKGATSVNSPWSKYREDVTAVRFVSEGGRKVVLPKDSHSLFYGFENCSTIDLSGCDMSSVESLSDMFCDCSSLASLDVTGWDTSQVTSMQGMFYRCSSLASLDLSGWDTSSVTDMGHMFSYCSSLASLNLSGWDTSSVTEMHSMFTWCSSLASLDLSSWDTSKVTDMADMFYSCSSLVSFDVSRWDTSSVIDMSSMFYYCTSLTSLGVSGWDTSSVIDMSYMFSDCSELTSLDVSRWDTSQVNGMLEMFYNCSSLASLDLSGWDTSRAGNMDSMFTGCTSLAKVKVGKGYTFNNCGLGDFPLPLGYEGNKWRSAKDGKLYTRDEIIANRTGVADTYTAVRLSFPDVPAGKWYKQVVQRAASLGLIAGFSDGTFGPDRNITRGQVAVILWRMAGQPKAGSGAKSFPDVKGGAYYYAAVRWASGAGVVNGNSDGTFRPNDNVTREQLAVMLSNYARRVGGLKVTGSKADYASMKDASKVASYAQQAVGWCFRNKILSGSNGNVLPQGNATRAQAAKMLVALYDMVNK